MHCKYMHICKYMQIYAYMHHASIYTYIRTCHVMSHRHRREWNLTAHHRPLSRTAFIRSAPGSPVHFRTSSIHDTLCLPRSWSPYTSPVIRLFSILSCLLMCPKYRCFRVLVWTSSFLLISVNVNTRSLVIIFVHCRILNSFHDTRVLKSLNTPLFLLLKRPDLASYVAMHWPHQCLHRPQFGTVADRLALPYHRQFDNDLHPHGQP